MMRTRFRAIAEANPLLGRAYTRLGTTYYRARFRAEERFSPDPLLVHQMGKVGSRTLTELLESLDLGRPVYHVHFLSDNGRSMLRRSAKARQSKGVVGPDSALILCEAVARRIARGSVRKRWEIVTAIREPIARTVSAFFQNAARWIPDFESRLDDSSLPGELTAAFFARPALHEQVLSWLDEEVKGVFGVDVYERPFPWSVGSDVFEGATARLLLIRLEDVDKAPEAIAQFLERPVGELRSVNRAEDKSYAQAYQQFLEQLELPAEFLERMYTSRFATHFYSPQENGAFRQRWGGG
jgi:hypothetical protein